jgi:Tol biopolymer transport system component
VGWLAENQTIVYGAMGGDGFNFKSHNLQSGETKDLFIVHNKAGFGSVSPDGQWIVFTDHVFGENGWSIFISRIDGSDRRLVADTSVPTAFISVWSPDGQWLIINTHKPGDPDGMETPVVVNPFTCQSVRLNAIHSMVEDWGP